MFYVAQFLQYRPTVCTEAFGLQLNYIYGRWPDNVMQNVTNARFLSTCESVMRMKMKPIQ